MKGIFALVVAVTLFSGVYVKADEQSSLALLKRLLEAVQKVDLEDRSAQLIMYNEAAGEVRVILQVCVKGDRSKVMCRKADGHVIQIIRASDKQVMKTIQTEKYFVMSKDGLPVPPSVEAVSVRNYPAGEYIVRSCEYTYGSGGRSPNSNNNAINLPSNDITMSHCNNKYFEIKK